MNISEDTRKAIWTANRLRSKSSYERLLDQYQTTTVSTGFSTTGIASVETFTELSKLARSLDILRHEYLNCIYDLKLWRSRTNDEYPSRRLEAMESFIREFDESLK